MADWCYIDGCEGKISGRGLCAAHYRRLRYWGDPRPDIPLAQGSGYCAYDQCKKPLTNRRANVKYCDKTCKGKDRYIRRQSNDPICIVPTCDKSIGNGGYGLCGAHYERLVRHGDIHIEIPVLESNCSVPMEFLVSEDAKYAYRWAFYAYNSRHIITFEMVHEFAYGLLRNWKGEA